MKRRLFSDRVTLLMSYLKAHLPSDTFWCDEMMKMLIYLADWEATKKRGKPLTTLKWYRTGNDCLKALGLESVNHWERYLPERSLWQKMKDKVARTEHFETLKKDEIEILEKVIALKTSDDLRIGSFAFRDYVFNTAPFCSKDPEASVPNTYAFPSFHTPSLESISSPQYNAYCSLQDQDQNQNTDSATTQNTSLALSES